MCWLMQEVNKVQGSNWPQGLHGLPRTPSSAPHLVLEVEVEVVLDVIVAAAGQQAGNQRPAIAVGALALHTQRRQLNDRVRQGIAWLRTLTLNQPTRKC